jgi:putative ABC transport system permease protein
MLKNYFTITLRTIRKRKLFTGINLLGLTAGITACLLIAVYVIDEYSYDRFHSNADRIYQVGLHKKFAEQDMRSVSVCPPLADAMLAEIPEVEATLRMHRWGKPVFQFGEKAFTEDKVFITEPTFFDFFSFPLIEGDAKTALKEPNTIVLTEKVARKYFGEQDPLNQLILMGEGAEKVPYKVTGVAADCPANSHFIFDVLISAEGPDNYFELNAWLNSGVFTYFLLRKNATLPEVESKLESIVAKYVAPELQQFLGNTPDQFRKAGGIYRYYATKITDIHLRSTSQIDIEPGGNRAYVYVFIGIGIFIIIIACINFMNMSTAQSAGRAKEIGLRKTLGSPRSHLIGQFLVESMLYSLVAVVLSVLLCYFLLPAFNRLSGKELSMINLLDLPFIFGVGLMLIVVGVLAGSYPAFYLTSFRVVEVMKGRVTPGLKSKGLRSTLVVFQFLISIFLIIVTSVVYMQINFMQQLQMGMDKKNVLVIETGHRLGNNGEAFRNALLQKTGLSKASFTVNKFPGVYNPGVMRSSRSGADHFVGNYWADVDFQSVLKFEMKDGRYFSKDFPSDSSGVVINEAAAREFGFDRSEGQELLYSPNGTYVPVHVIGIMKDFNFESYRDQVRPMAIFPFPPAVGNLMVRYQGNAQTAMSNAFELWKQFAGHEPFEYSFMDENFDKQYRSEERMGHVLAIFSGLAIVIACLGLFALAAFTAEQRTKEIGIRKVLGASVGSLSILLTKEFIQLVFIALLPAATLGGWVSSRWLSEFAYRVEIHPLIFVGAGISAIAIAWLTVAFQSIKAAHANPVDSLRHE